MPGPHRSTLTEKLEKAASEEFEERRKMMIEVLKHTRADDGGTLWDKLYGHQDAAETIAPLSLRVGHRNEADRLAVKVEIGRRMKIVKAVLFRSGLLPVYAIQDPKRWHAMHEVFPTDEDYEREVEAQIAACDGWQNTQSSQTWWMEG